MPIINKDSIKLRKCCKCGGNKTTKNYNGTPVWFNHKCDKDGCTKYLCRSCYGKIAYRSYNTDYIAEWRIGNLDPLSPSGKGFIGQQIVAKTYGVEDCNLKMDDFRFYVDISKISEYGYSEVKIRTLNTNHQWSFDTGRPQKYDSIFLVCMDKNVPWKDVERLYVIPSDTVLNTVKSGITITKNPSKGSQWYEEFRIDEKPFNDTYHNMKLDNCKILRNTNNDI